jgi:hypothetical protein
VRAGPEGGGHLGAPDVQVAVLQPDFLVELPGPLDGERQRIGLGQDLDRGRRDLDLAGRQLRVLVPGRTPLHGAGDQHAVLGPQVVGDVLFAQHDLHDPAAVTQVDEDDATVIATTGDPAGQPDLLARRARPERACLMAADHRLASLQS